MKITYNKDYKTFSRPRNLQAKKLIQFSSIENYNIDNVNIKETARDFIFIKIKSNSKDLTEKYIIPNLILSSSGKGVQCFTANGSPYRSYQKLSFGFAVISRTDDYSFEFKFYTTGHCEAYAASRAYTDITINASESVELKNKYKNFITEVFSINPSSRLEIFNNVYTTTPEYRYEYYILWEQLKVLIAKMFDLDEKVINKDVLTLVEKILKEEENDKEAA